jgi:hypothetical protein
MLRMCRDWVLFDRCKVFQHINIPHRVRNGDRFSVTFSSNNKTFVFNVREIVQVGNECWLQEQPNPDADPQLAVDTLVVSSCAPAP